MGFLTCVQYSAFCSSQFPHPRNKRYFSFWMCLESWCDAWIRSKNCTASAHSDTLLPKHFNTVHHWITSKIVLIFPYLSLNTVCTCSSVIIVFLNWFLGSVFASQGFFGNNCRKSPISPSNQIKQAECQPQTNFIVFCMKTYVWNVGRVLSMQPEWAFSCTCLIFNSPEIQNMCGKILKLWIWDVNNEVCLIPKF